MAKTQQRQLWLVLLFLLMAKPLFGQGLTILTPFDGKIYLSRNDKIHVVARASTERTTLIISNGKVDYQPQFVTNKQPYSYGHFLLPLRPGVNRFRAFPGKKSFTVTYKPLRSLLRVNFEKESHYLFHRKEVIPRDCQGCHQEDKDLVREIIQPPPYAPFSPACYSCHKSITNNSASRHGPAAVWQCRTCHQNNPATDRITILEGKIDSLCFRCHINKRKWKKMEHLHGHVGTGDCTVCHNPHGDKYPFQLWADGKAELCVTCHVDKKKLLNIQDKPRYVHGIINGMGCIACHDPHAAPHRFQLSSSVSDLCASCHTAFKDMKKGHPVGGHPLQGMKDPRRHERSFSCISCHDPHGSQFSYLLIGDVLGGHVCSKCHK